MRRLVLLAGVLLAGCGGSSAPPPARVHHAPRRAASEVIYLRRLPTTAEVYETLTIRADGRMLVGKFIGEDTGVEYHRHRLDAAGRARLRRLIARTHGPLTATHGRPTRLNTTWILKIEGREVVAHDGRVPVKLRPLLAFLEPFVNG